MSFIIGTSYIVLALDVFHLKTYLKALKNCVTTAINCTNIRYSVHNTYVLVYVYNIQQ